VVVSHEKPFFERHGGESASAFGVTKVQQYSMKRTIKNYIALFMKITNAGHMQS
jgi:hypothetical protein